MSSIKNPELKEQFLALAKRFEKLASDENPNKSEVFELTKLIRSWFSHWNGTDELVDKVIIWGRFFFSHYFTDPTPEFHRDLMGKIFSGKNEFRAAPRGFSKTSLIQVCISFIVAHSKKKFILLIEKTFTEAGEVLDGIRTEFADNNKIKAIYGNIIGKQTGSDAKDKDAEADMLLNGVRLRGKGWDAPLRGLKHRNNRPDLIVLDDIETDEHINNPEQRQKSLDKYNKVLVPALSMDGSIKVYGTILHYDSLLKNLIEWHDGKIYEAFDPDSDDPKGTLLWAERWTYEKLMEKKGEMESKGFGGNAFAQEYLNRPIDEESRKFKHQWLWNPNREFEIKELEGMVLDVVATIDPAESENKGSDYTGSIVSGVNRETDDWYFIHVEMERRGIRELIAHIFWIWEEFSPMGLQKIGVAKKAFEFQILPLLKAESKRRNIFPIVFELKEGKRNKEARIEGALSGRAELGRLWFKKNPTDHTNKLREQLYDFPRAKFDDLADAASFIEDVKEASAGLSKGRGIPISQTVPPDYGGAVHSVEEA